MKKLLSVILLVSFLLSSVSFAEGSTLLDLIYSLDFETLSYVKQQVDKRYEELKKQKELETGVEIVDWEKTYFVDSFGDPTDEAYIRNHTLIEGTFSNSATNNKRLLVRMLISADDIAFMLYEYGNSQVKAYGKQYYTILIKNEEGITTRSVGVIYSDRILISTDKLENAFLEMLRKPQILRIYFQNQTYSTETYLFTLNTTGFNEIYTATFGE